jgi:hypothetical protein
MGITWTQLHMHDPSRRRAAYLIKHTGKPLTPSSTPLPLGRPESSEAPTIPLLIIFISGRDFAIGQQSEAKALKSLTHPTGQASSNLVELFDNKISSTLFGATA